MNAVRLERQLGAPPALAFQALSDVLRDIAAQSGPWRGFSLHVDLGDAGFVDVGYVAIPISLSVEPAKPGPRQLDVSIHSLRHPDAFPAFSGSLGIDASGSNGATLWMEGAYETPLGGIGALVDATFLRGVAQRALENLTEDVAVACRARIDKRESEYARYHLFGRAT